MVKRSKQVLILPLHQYPYVFTQFYLLLHITSKHYVNWYNVTAIISYQIIMNHKGILRHQIPSQLGLWPHTPLSKGQPKTLYWKKNQKIVAENSNHGHHLNCVEKTLQNTYSNKLYNRSKFVLKNRFCYRVKKHQTVTAQILHIFKIF